MKTLLPFTRPTIDEETIQAVAEVLRSGWLASGPKVAATLVDEDEWWAKMLGRKRAA